MPELIRYFVFLTNLICPALGRFRLAERRRALERLPH
ncbi:Uncharacterised protein [Citrobacter amalonaticus]|nr:hypothetical protein AZ012_000527 [Citrobacter amalonaticus]SUX62780.1 Uncharacterised protein [Citrobacter amalonaticus]